MPEAFGSEVIREAKKQKFTGYQPEMWAVRKDFILSAIYSIETAIGYMKSIKSDVPQWQKQTDDDVQQMQTVLELLRDLPADGDILPTAIKHKEMK